MRIGKTMKNGVFLHLGGWSPGIMGKWQAICRGGRKGLMPEPLTDASLLERFVSRREEAAFVALVERHGPRVQRICRRILRNEHDVEDVFQATFLVLARRAAGIAWRDSVGGWLGAVAHRLALGARSDVTRQRRRETSMTSLLGDSPAGHADLGIGLAESDQSLVDPCALLERAEAGRLLKDELLQLPEKYRSPVVLCYLEGLTHEEAAVELGCPTGSMSRRLERAQAILRRRLIHRGLSFAVGLVAVTIAFFSVWSICRDHGQSAAALRQAMASLAPLSERGAGIEDVIARIDRGETDHDHDRIIALTQRAIRVAEEIAPYEPGKEPEQWRRYLSEMRVSSALLAQATTENDRPSMLWAARRLNAACLGCHQVFCLSGDRSGSGTGFVLPRGEPASLPGARSRFSGLILRETTVQPARRLGPEMITVSAVALFMP